MDTERWHREDTLALGPLGAKSQKAGGGWKGLQSRSLAWIPDLPFVSCMIPKSLFNCSTYSPVNWDELFQGVVNRIK